MLAAWNRLFTDTKLGVHVLVCVFAISSWVDINGMWVELPIFVTHLPEKWTLPSYVTVLSQIANVGPIIFLVLVSCVRKTSVSKLTLDKVTSYAIMAVGVTSTLLLAFLWQRTHYFLSGERSLALLALSFFLSLMDCTSSLAYVAFLAALKPAYTSSFFIGEGLSGFIPAMLALGQGAGDIVCLNGSSTHEVKNATSGEVVNVTSYYQYPTYTPPRFSVQVFFLLLSVLIALSMVAFTLLNCWGYCKDEFVSAVSSFDPQNESAVKERSKLDESTEGTINRACSAGMDESIEGTINHAGKDESIKGTINHAGKDEVEKQRNGFEEDFTDLSKTSTSSSSGPVYGSFGSQDSGSSFGQGQVALVEGLEGKDVSTVTIVLLLLQVVVINFLINSFLLSVQVYSSLPFGITTYNLVVTLTNIANPVACLTSLFLIVTSPVVITVLTSLGCACGAYIIAEATLSPAPPLVGETAGEALAIIVWVTASFFLTYAKVSVAGVLRHVGRRALIWYGAATQLGALIGAVTGFVLVNKFKVFKDASWC